MQDNKGLGGVEETISHISTPYIPLSMRVIERRSDTLYLRLPHELQREIHGGCQCEYCRYHQALTPMWDTLAVPISAVIGDYDCSWVVHMPGKEGPAEPARPASKGDAR